MKNKLKIQSSKFKTNEKGFGLIEIIITGVIISISFVAFLTFILFSRDASSKAQRNTEAVAKAEEALEVVRKLRDDGYTANITSKTVGTTYYPTLVSNAWTLSTTNPNTYYTTTIVLSTVARDGSFNIAGSGTVDPNTKKVAATVSWNDSGTKNVVLTTYITNIKNN
ncbi:MAG TPA: hypothetical protein VLE47_01685 [Candidatus Saccharimonadales bacterium]|nr:hypothetical protein [Candidatus Saccharimonadales bacterium]